MHQWKTADDQTWSEIATLEEAIHRFLDGKITMEELRPLRTFYGVYGQRHKDRHMVRIKVPQGILDDQQLETLGRIAREFSRGFGYVTTRQDIQFHFVLLEKMPALLRLLAEAGLITREAGGNIVRNVTCDPLAGVCPQEVFDVTPYSNAVSRHFLRHPASQTLPRKIKIAFAGCPHDHALTWIHDIGAQAAIKDGQRGFRLMVGGGLGAVPRAALPFTEFIPEGELVRTCEAIVRVFDRTGERKNRNKARLKFVISRLGMEEFRHLVQQELATMPAANSDAYAEPDFSQVEGPPDYPQPAQAVPPSEGFDLWRAVNVVPQKQAGYNTVQISLPVGTVTAEQFEALADLSRRFGGGRVRTTIEQNLVLRWVRESDLPALHSALTQAQVALPTAETILDPVACPGVETCMSALTNSKAMARAITQEFKQDGYLQDPLLRASRIKASGCPNSCGHHHVADLGLYGCVLHVDGRLLPVYEILIGGGDGAALATPVMKIAAKRIPAALRALADHYRQARNPEETLREFLRRMSSDQLRQVLTEYSHMPTFVEDPTAYVDWDGQGLFSLDERGEGECSV